MPVRLTYLFVLCFIYKYVNGKTSCRIVIGEIKDCKDFDNQHFSTKPITYEVKNICGEAHYVIGGCVEVKLKVDEEFQIDLVVMKETENGEQKTMSIGGSLCESLQDDDSPVKKALEVLNITGCPIFEDKYCIANDGKPKTINLNDFQDLCPEFVAEYTCSVSTFIDPMHPISCHVVSFAVEEHESHDGDQDDEDCDK